MSHDLDLQQLREQNRRSWNAVVPAHESHRADPAGFLRGGGLTLFPEERALLGDIAGASIAHLFCNSGQDTLSLARLGASVTGVDISDVAVERARGLAAATGIDASFERMDVYDWLRETAQSPRRFDVVYCGYGVICWLHAVRAWARGAAAVLKPGGRCVLVEFHPNSNMFDAEWRLVRAYPAGGRLLTLPGVGDYVGDSQGGLTPGGYLPGVQSFQNPEPCYLFTWGVGEVVTAVAEAGLTLVALRDYPFISGERPFKNLREAAGRRMLPPVEAPVIPLMYGLAARKL